jgi:hypothetical protein
LTGFQVGMSHGAVAKLCKPVNCEGAIREESQQSPAKRREKACVEDDTTLNLGSTTVQITKLDIAHRLIREVVQGRPHILTGFGHGSWSQKIILVPAQ